MILACGEALIDMLPRESAAGEAAFAPYAGGAVFNTAIALGRLGVPAGFFSGLSSDLFGDLLRQTLQASRVDYSPAHVSRRPTTLAFVRLTGGHASYTFYDENTAGRMLTPEDLPEVSAEALFFGGISLVGEPCGSAYEALQVREAAARVTMIDPNIRPSFIEDEAAYRARVGRMMARADIVKLSDEDLFWLMGQGATAGQGARDPGDAAPSSSASPRGRRARPATPPSSRCRVAAPQGARSSTPWAPATPSTRASSPASTRPAR